MDVVILAGGKCEPALAEATAVEYRAEVPFMGRTMAEIVLEAVRPVGSPILVGGPPGLTDRHVEAGSNFVGSIAAGLGAVTTDTFLLVTVDLPCLTTHAVSDFIGRCDPRMALNYPVIHIEDCDREFPGMKRTRLALREGVFTGGNLALMNKELMQRAVPVLQKAYEHRKSPVKLAGLIGFGTLGRIILARMSPASLSISVLERKVGAFLGVPVRAVVTPFPEIGADIDNLSQYNSLIGLKTNQQ